MKRNYLVLSLLALVLVLGLSVGNAWSYFTDSTWAEGSVSLKKPTTTITEIVENKQKKLTITNNRESVPVWVRARAFVPAAFVDEDSNTSGNGWSAGGLEEWHEYSEPLAPGASTDELIVTFSFPEPYSETNTGGVREGDEYNIVVIYECLPVSYDADGNPLPAQWN